MIIKVTEWIGIGMIFALLIVYIVYSREKLFRQKFAFPIFLILISAVISMFAAYAYHDQPFLRTAIAQRAIYFYFIYFLLHYMKMDGVFIIKLIMIFGLVYMAIYLTQYMAFPRQITYSYMFIDRGTLRIFLSGAGYLVIGYFIYLYLTFKAFRIRYVIFMLLAYMIFVLLGTRQIIASILLLTILFILQSRVVKSKILIFSLIGLSIVPIFLLFQDIIIAMFDVTLEQSQSVDSNVRVRAADYFLTEFYPSNFAYFTGNGVHGSSMYGLKVIRIMEEYKFFQSDIGLIGEFTQYGALFVIGVLIILYRVLTVKLPEKLMFIKYNFLGIILTLVTGAGAFGSSGTNILINSMVLYLVDLYLNDDKAFRNFPVSVKRKPKVEVNLESLQHNTV
jgi:hypothetical protein